MTDQPTPEPDETLSALDAEQKIVREHTLNPHVIGQQLSEIESWFWTHLADIRDAARQQIGGPLPDDVTATPARTTPDNAATSSDTADNPLRRLRTQLAAERDKARHAEQYPRPDLNHLRVTAHNGIAAGLEIALGYVDQQMREAGEMAEVERAARYEQAVQQVQSSGPQPAAHDAGPTVAECTEADRAWPLQQEGE